MTRTRNQGTAPQHLAKFFFLVLPFFATSTLAQTSTQKHLPIIDVHVHAPYRLKQDLHRGPRSNQSPLTSDSVGDVQSLDCQPIKGNVIVSRWVHDMNTEAF